MFSMLLWSCVNITKRKHRSGYHIEWDIAKTKKRVPIKNILDDEFVNSKNNTLIDFKIASKNKKVITNKENAITGLDDNNSIKSADHYYYNDYIDKTTITSEGRKKINHISKKNNGHLFWFLGGSIFLALAGRKKVNKLSQWAAANKMKAQTLVGFSATLLPVVSFMHGWTFGDSDLIDFETGAFSTLGLVSIGAYFHKKTNKNFFVRKFKEFMFLVALIGLFNSVGNKLSERFHKNEHSISFEKSQNDDFVFSSLKKVDDTSNKLLKIFGKAFLSLLILGILFALEILVLSFACNLACSGYGIAAAVLGVLGTLGLTTLFIFGLISIWKKNKGKKENLNDAERAENKKIVGNILLTLLSVLIGLLVVLSMIY